MTLHCWKGELDGKNYDIPQENERATLKENLSFYAINCNGNM